MTSYGLSAVLRIALEQALHGFHEKCSHDAESDDVPFTGDVTTTAGELDIVSRHGLSSYITVSHASSCFSLLTIRCICCIPTLQARSAILVDQESCFADSSTNLASFHCLKNKSRGNDGNNE